MSIFLREARLVISQDILFDLRGKVSIVTGSGGGLGQTIAIGLAKYGSNVAIVDINIDKAKSVAKEIESLGRSALIARADVTHKQDVDKMVQEVLDKFGTIDVLVNNAGIARRARAEEMSEKDWDEVISVNLKGVFLCCQAVGKVMIKKRRGKIINVASVVGRRGLFHPLDLASGYCASKGGVIQLTRALAAEWAKYDIHVNAIAPTYFMTEMTRVLLENKEFLDYLKWKIPLQRPGEPEELVGPVVFLASDASSMITGHILNVDGGWTAI